MNLNLDICSQAGPKAYTVLLTRVTKWQIDGRFSLEKVGMRKNLRGQHLLAIAEENLHHLCYFHGTCLSMSR